MVILTASSSRMDVAKLIYWYVCMYVCMYVCRYIGRQGIQIHHSRSDVMYTWIGRQRVKYLPTYLHTYIQSVDMLTDLFRAGGVRTQLVFVSACHSESAGHSFAAAGVRKSPSFSSRNV